MLKNQYISLILFFIVFVTLVNLYYKPYLADRNQPLYWLKNITNPISKVACTLQGFKCPTDDMCNCEALCSNGTEFVPFRILEEDRVYVLNQKLSPGTYCLPKGIGSCNLKTSYHIFSMAGWSCISINDDIFKKDKQKACKNEEAEDNEKNVLWDYLKNEKAGDNIVNYYEPFQNGYRFRCKCDSKSLDNTRMLSIFPFVCLVDYCLRSFQHPLPNMGWDGKKCECGPYFHADPNDESSPCQNIQSTQIHNHEFIGEVKCMTEKSFIKQPLICPTADGSVSFKEYFFAGNQPRDFINELIKII